MVLARPSLAPSKPILFSDSDTSIVHFSQNDALIVTMLISNCRASKILIDGGSSVNILYGGALDKMEDTPKTALSPQTQYQLYGFDGNETHSPGTISLLVRANPTTSSRNFTW